MVVMLCTIKIHKGDWFRESFSSTGVFTTQETYSLSQLFADESKYKNDLNNDGNIGDVITAVIGDNGTLDYIKRAQDPI